MCGSTRRLTAFYDGCLCSMLIPIDSLPRYSLLALLWSWGGSRGRRWSRICLSSFSPQMMDRPAIGDDKQDNQGVEHSLFSERLVSPVLSVRRAAWEWWQSIFTQDTLTIAHIHVFENPTGRIGHCIRINQVLIGLFELLALSTHLTERFISNLLRRGTQTTLDY